MTQPEDIQWQVSGSEFVANLITDKSHHVDVFVDTKDFTWRAQFSLSDDLELCELAKHNDIRGAQYDAIRNIEHLLGDIIKQVCPVPLRRKEHQ